MPVLQQLVLTYPHPLVLTAKNSHKPEIEILVEKLKWKMENSSSLHPTP